MDNSNLEHMLNDIIEDNNNLEYMLNEIIEDNKNLKLTLDHEIRSSIELLKNDTKFYLKEIKDLRNENKELRLLIENSFKINQWKLNKGVKNE